MVTKSHFRKKKRIPESAKPIAYGKIIKKKTDSVMYLDAFKNKKNTI